MACTFSLVFFPWPVSLRIMDSNPSPIFTHFYQIWTNIFFENFLLLCTHLSQFLFFFPFLLFSCFSLFSPVFTCFQLFSTISLVSTHCHLYGLYYIALSQLICIPLLNYQPKYCSQTFYFLLKGRIFSVCKLYLSTEGSYQLKCYQHVNASRSVES